MHTLSFFLKLAHFSAAAILTTAALIAPHRAQAGAFNGLSPAWREVPYHALVHALANALLEQTVRTLDIGERTALYLKAQKIFKSEHPYTAIAYPINYYGLNKNVTGFKAYMFGATVFYGVGLKK